MEKLHKSKTPWLDRVEPFRICGNLYFAGSRGCSSHVIDTGEGLILIDSGYPQMLYLLIDNLYSLGFNPRDIKYIVHSHGHYDHLGATRALVELTGAKTFLGAPDRDYANGNADLTWAREIGWEYHEAFEPDVLLHDGDTISLGNTVIRCVSTPGHTPGTMSFFFDVYDGDKTYTCAMHGGVGQNSMTKHFLQKYGLSLDCRQQFLDGLARVRDEKVDIFIGNHVGNNHTEEKAKQMREHPEAGNPFIDPGEWARFIDSCRDQMLRLLEKPEEQPD